MEQVASECEVSNQQWVIQKEAWGITQNEQSEISNDNRENGSLVLKLWTNTTQPECEAPYWRPVEENENVMAHGWPLQPHTDVSATRLHGGLYNTSDK